MKVSIITDVLNAKDTIEDTVLNVLCQTYKDIEYIVIDGKSTDGTIEVIDKYRARIDKFVSEPDNNHFEAMNKGLKLATGEIVGFLHSDDVYATDKIVARVAKEFEERDMDCLWGDLVYVSKKNPEKVLRYWRSCDYRDYLFNSGWMPPHPTFFAKRTVYESYGYFDTNLQISADYEMMLRLLHIHRISSYYLSGIMVKMRAGGLSNRSIRNLLHKSREDYRAWRINELKASVPRVVAKNVSKIPQFFMRPDGLPL
jgi:glycosyltransferase